MEIIPDEIYVQVDLMEYEKKGQGKTSLDVIKSNFLQSCKSIGLPDSLITTAFYEGSSTTYSRKKKKSDLFASISYEIKFTNIKDIDKLVEKLDDDATQNFSVVRTDHTKMTEFRKQLKTQAIKAAKEKGIYLSEAIGEKLGEAVTIMEPDENGGFYMENSQISNGRYVQAFSNYSTSSDEEGGTIDFKKIKLRYQINVIFALK